MDRSEVISKYNNGMSIQSLADEYQVSKQRIDQIVHYDKFHCRNILRYALLHEKIQKQSCEICGSVNSSAHHKDYSKPLEITWLCDKCHGETRKGEKHTYQFNEQRDPEIVFDFKSGMSIKQISEKHSISENSIYIILYHSGIESVRKPWKHGTANGYIHHGCRCTLCTKANTERCKKYRK